MKFTRRTAAVAMAAFAGLGTARAADPAQITIIVPYPPGGLSDNLARVTGKALSQNMGVPVIVENRPGANGVLGLQAIAHAKPDGATIGMVPASVLTVNPALYKTMKVDTVKDVEMLTLAITIPNVLVVHPSVPVHTIDELLAYLRRSGGAGNIQMAFENLPVALPYIQSGKLRAIGVTSTNPSPQAPDIPPIGRTLPGFEDNIWFGFIAPAGLPKEFASKLSAQLVKAIKSDDVSKPMRERGAAITTSTPEEMRKVVLAERDKWARLVVERGISVD